MQAQYSEGETFERLVASEVDLHGRTYEHCTFQRCDLSRADLSKSKFIACTFTGCDLSMVRWRGASLQDVAFSECKLLGVDFSVCSEMLFSVRFDACTLDHSILAGRRMSKTRFSKCSLKGVDLEGADLSAAVFQQCDLQDAVFARTVLKGADLTTAHGFRIHPDGNELEGARFSVEGAIGLLAPYGVVVE